MKNLEVPDTGEPADGGARSTGGIEPDAEAQPVKPWKFHPLTLFSCFTLCFVLLLVVLLDVYPSARERGFWDAVQGPGTSWTTAEAAMRREGIQPIVYHHGMYFAVDLLPKHRWLRRFGREWLGPLRDYIPQAYFTIYVDRGVIRKISR